MSLPQGQREIVEPGQEILVPVSALPLFAQGPFGV